MKGFYQFFYELQVNLGTGSKDPRFDLSGSDKDINELLTVLVGDNYKKRVALVIQSGGKIEIDIRGNDRSEPVKKVLNLYTQDDQTQELIRKLTDLKRSNEAVRKFLDAVQNFDDTRKT